MHFDEFKEFKTDLCSIGQPGICFWSCCCPGIRWADSMSKLGIHGFYSGFWFLTALYCISFIPLCTLVCFAVVVAYMTYHRQELRKAFDFHDQGGSTYFTD